MAAVLIRISTPPKAATVASMALAMEPPLPSKRPEVPGQDAGVVGERAHHALDVALQARILRGVGEDFSAGACFWRYARWIQLL